MENKKFKRDGLPYRQGVIGIVMDDDGKFLIVQAVIYGENDWRFPGGGIKKNETLENSLLRELEEELGTKGFEIVKKVNFINRYEWPDQLIEREFKKKGTTHRGQEQTSFLVKFKGKKEDIKIQPKELRRIKWVEYDELKDHFTFPNQWDNAEKVLREII